MGYHMDNGGKELWYLLLCTGISFFGLYFIFHQGIDYKVKTKRGRIELRETLDSAHLKSFDTMSNEIKANENNYNAFKTDPLKKVLKKSRENMKDSVKIWNMGKAVKDGPFDHFWDGVTM